MFHRHKCVEFRLSQMCAIHDHNKSTFLLSRRNGNGVSLSASGRFPNVMNFAVWPSFTIVKSRNRQFFPLWFHTRIARALKPSLIFTTYALNNKRSENKWRHFSYPNLLFIRNSFDLNFLLWKFQIPRLIFTFSIGNVAVIWHSVEPKRLPFSLSVFEPFNSRFALFLTFVENFDSLSIVRNEPTLFRV